MYVFSFPSAFFLGILWSKEKFNCPKFSTSYYYYYLNISSFPLLFFIFLQQTLLSQTFLLFLWEPRLFPLPPLLLFGLIWRYLAINLLALWVLDRSSLSLLHCFFFSYDLSWFGLYGTAILLLQFPAESTGEDTIGRSWLWLLELRFRLLLTYSYYLILL